MANHDGFEFERYIKETFQPEKQKAILDLLKGVFLWVENHEKISKEEFRLIIDKINSLPAPQFIRDYEKTLSPGKGMDKLALEIKELLQNPKVQEVLEELKQHEEKPLSYNERMSALCRRLDSPKIIEFLAKAEQARKQAKVEGAKP